MKFIALLMILISLIGCASKKLEEHPSGLEIIEVTPNKWTSITKQNLLHLAQVYDLSPFLYTKKIQIQPQVKSHSHPVLTLNTRHAENPKKILSTFLHEELHWWLASQKKETSEALRELKKVYPDAPLNQGATKDSTWLHLIVCYLELKSLSFYIGEKEARGVIYSLMKKDQIYPWVYFQVLNKDFAIKSIVAKNKLLPPPLN